MRKLLVCLVIAVLLFGTVALSEDLPGLPGLVQEGNRIVGSLEIGRDFPLQVDMPLPKEVEGSVKQYKVQRIQITKSEVRALLNGRTMPAKPGETWKIYTLDQTEYRQFVYQAEALLYETFYPPNAPLPLDSETKNPSLHLANQQAKSLLDAWGIPYAYPFYQVCNAARGADVSLRGTPLHTGGEVAEYLLGDSGPDAQYEYDYYGKERKLFEEEYSLIRARQQVDEIPFAISDIKSPYYLPDSPQFDEGVYVLLQYNSRGEIVYADACNLHTVAEESGEPVIVLGWQECLATLPQDNPFFDGLLAAKAIGAELCYAINGKHLTYPVWQFLVEFQQPADSALQQYLCFAIYVDACSGKPL